MGWRWRKSMRRGPLRINVSKGGVGWSFGVPGLRYGRCPRGQPYVTVGIPGTGLYWMKYLKKTGSPLRRAHSPSPTPTPPPNPAPPPISGPTVDRWWEDHQ
jgi:hypothetical protein